jgi:hypothetical protein
MSREAGVNVRTIEKVLALVVLLGGAACGGGGSAGNGHPGSSSGGGSSSSSGGGGSSSGGSSGGGAITLPAAHARFDYQISEPYTPLGDVGIVDRDWSASPVAGLYNVCYVNAFQTQPDGPRPDATSPYTSAWWKANHDDLLLKKGGVYVTDDEWSEIVLDVSSSDKRARVLAALAPQLDACAAKGFQGVEPDNLNSWERSQGLLSMADDIEMAKLLAGYAHQKGLAIAQKNTSEIAMEISARRAQIGFDFAIVEECQPYGDCDAFSDVYGDRWFEIEYSDFADDGGVQNLKDACQARGATVSVILRDRNVTPRGNAAYVYRVCKDVGF